MENYPIKSVTFGGFDKQDVIHYIEQTAQKAAESEKQLREENERLRSQMEELQEQTEHLQAQVESLTAERQQLQESLTREQEARQALEPLKPLEAEVKLLKAEMDVMRPDAEAYAQFRERIGAIECEARKRAADLERDAAQKTRQTMEEFRKQYQVLMSTFAAASAHATSELRKVEVNLSQLPRVMDQTGAELNELAALLEKEGKTEDASLRS